MSNMVEKSFVKKYGLEGTGMPVVISETTRRLVSSLSRRSDFIIESGKEYCRLEQKRFGGLPRPGEPGSERHFIPIEDV